MNTIGTPFRLKLAVLSSLLIMIVSIDTYAQDEPEERKRSKEEKKRFKEATGNMDIQDYYKAVDEFEKLADEFPDVPEYAYWAGYCGYHTFQMRRALPYLQKAQKWFDAQDINLFLAEAYHRDEQIDSARKYYQLHKEDINNGITGTEESMIDVYITQCDVAEKFLSEPKDVEIINVGGNINGEHADYSPVISADETEMIFTSRRPHYVSEEDSLTILDPTDDFPYETLHISYKDEKTGEWGKSQFMGDTVNDKSHHSASVGLSPDGRILYMYRTVGNAFWGDLFKSEKRDEIWSTPVAMQDGINTTKWWETRASITTDEKRLFFTSNRPKNDESAKDVDRDIYMARKLPNGKWAEPFNLDTMINTEYDEDSPFIHPDGVTLYFSSNGPNSMGGFDIFTSTFDKATETWSEPVNMGYPINSTGDDVGFVWSADKTHAYYASARKEGQGGRDIYLVVMPEESVAMVYFKGKVIDAVTKKPVMAKIEIMDQETNQIFQLLNSNLLTGKFNTSINPGHYVVRVDADGYEHESGTVSAPEVEDYLEIRETYELRKRETIVAEIDSGETVVIDMPITLSDGEVTKDAEKELIPLVNILKEQDEVEMEILVYTFRKPADSLVAVFETQNEADKIVHRLEELGAPRERMTPKGGGYIKPTTLEFIEMAKTGTDLVEVILHQPEVDIDFGRFVPYEELKDEEHELSADEREIEDILPLGRIHFETASAKIKDDESYKIIDEAAAYMRKYPNLVIEVGGHTDYVGGDSYNKKLSDRRSKRIVEQLVYLGIDRSRLVPKGYGEDKPIAPNETAQGRALNRRTEFKIIGYTDNTGNTGNGQNPGLSSGDSTGTPSTGITPKPKPQLVEAFTEDELKEGYKFKLKPVHFETASAKIKDDESYDIIKEVADILLKYPQILKVEVAGHTDDRGSSPYNQDLSQRRSTSVVKQLVKDGISMGRMVPKGYGEDSPIDTNDTKEGRQKNRRTEVVILEMKK